MFLTLLACVFAAMMGSIFFMALGYLLQKKAIQGTCGGLANYQKTSATSTCSLCHKDLAADTTTCLDVPAMRALRDDTDSDVNA